MWTARPPLAALLLVLACPAARSDDGSKPPDDPDPGFLEFLGSVDRLAEVNPDYLSQAGPIPPGRAPVKPTAPAPSPPPPQPQPLPPPSASASGLPR